MITPAAVIHDPAVTAGTPEQKSNECPGQPSVDTEPTASSDACIEASTAIEVTSMPGDTAGKDEERESECAVHVEAEPEDIRESRSEDAFDTSVRDSLKELPIEEPGSSSDHSEEVLPSPCSSGASSLEELSQKLEQTSIEDNEDSEDANAESEPSLEIVAPGPIYGLSLELVAFILDFLHDDKLALKSCSLVHPSWTEACRHHLFYSIYFRRRSTTNLSSCILRPLQDGDIPPLVTHKIQYISFMNAEERIDLFDLRQVLSFLPNVVYLQLSAVSFVEGWKADEVISESNEQPSVPLLQPYPLEELTLSRMNLTRRELSAIISMFPPKYLHIERHVGLCEDNGDMTILPKKIEVDNLPAVAPERVRMGFQRGCRFDLVSGSLQNTQASQSLEYLQLRMIKDDEASVIETFLHTIPRNIWALELELYGCSSTEASREGRGSGFGLTVLEKLTWLRLDFADCQDSAHLLHQILQEALAARSFDSRLAVHLSVQKEHLKDIGAWDHILWSYRDRIDRLKIWVRSQSIDDADEYGMEYGRRLNAEEKQLVQERMPTICSIGLLRFDRYLGDAD